MSVKRRTCIGLVILGIAAWSAAWSGDGSRKGLWDISAGLVDTDYDLGLNFTAAYLIDYKRVRFDFSFIDLNWYSGEAEGFRKETVSGGGTICRDESNGQFADSEKCEEGEADFAISVETGYRLSKLKYPTVIGLGYRIGGDEDLGGDDTAFGSVNVFGPKQKFYGNARIAADYIQLSWGVVF